MLYLKWWLACPHGSWISIHEGSELVAEPGTLPGMEIFGKAHDPLDASVRWTVWTVTDNQAQHADFGCRP